MVGVLGRAGAMGQDPDRSAALAVGVAEAVRARVAAAEDDDVLASGGDRDLHVGREACDLPVLLHQVVHREMDAAEIAAWYVEGSSLQGADGEDDCVELALEVLRRWILADVGVGAELDPFLLHYGDAAVDDPLFDLVVGDAVPEEATDPIVLLEDDGGVPGPVELLRRREPGRPATDDGDLPACTLLRRRGLGTTHPSSKALLMMESSISFMVTGSSLMARTHAASHGAGQSVPVNSGKLLVWCRRSMACFQCSRYTRSFQSGIRFPRGQPVLQKGTPQSMQREAWPLSSSSGIGS